MSLVADRSLKRCRDAIEVLQRLAGDILVSGVSSSPAKTALYIGVISFVFTPPAWDD